MVSKPYKAYIIAGPNGAGKTTFARQLLAELALDGQSMAVQFLNADEIARALMAARPGLGSARIAAGRELRKRLEYHYSQRNDFMVETTLSSRSYARQIRCWSTAGYQTELYYLRLASLEASIDRVKRRVAKGGHDIPEADLRRRFVKSVLNLDAYYKPNVDKWSVYDSVEGSFEFVESGGRS